MKKKIFYILLSILAIPFIVKAENLEEYKLKWNETNEYSGYVYNPYMELNKEFMDNTIGNNSYNRSQVITTSNGYIIIDYSSISLINRKKGIEKTLQYSAMQYIENNGYFYIISYDYSTEKYTIEKVDENLEIKDKLVLETTHIADVYLESDKLVVIHSTVNTSNEYTAHVVQLDINDFSKQTSSSIFTKYKIYKSNNKIFYDSYYNYYDLDNNHKLIPRNLNSDNSYMIINGTTITKYNSNGEEIKKVTKAPTDSFYLHESKIVKNGENYYFVQSQYKNISGSKYSKRAVYYLLDEELNEKNTYTIISDSESYWNYYVYLYKNEKGVFTQYNYKYYQINDDFSFTTSTSSNAYNEEDVSSTNYETPENVELYNEMSRIAYDYVYSKRTELKETYESVWTDYTFDAYYDENTKEAIIGITILFTIYDGSTYTYKEEAVLLIFDTTKTSDNMNEISLINQKEVNEEYYNQNNRVVVKDDYIIVGVTSNYKTNLYFYNRENGNLETFLSKDTKDYTIEYIDFEKGHLMLIYTEHYQEEVSIKGITEHSSESMGLAMISYWHKGLYRRGAASIIEYYERPFEVLTKDDGNGKVTSSKEKAESGESILFTVTPNKDYELKEVKVTDAYGNTITFTEYTFTMPTSDVIIEATFVPVNPDTSDIFIIASITIVIGTLISYLNIKKMKELS